MQKLEKLHSTLTKQMGKEPTDEEWASAAGVELAVLRRRLALGRAARIKLIQVHTNLQFTMSHILNPLLRSHSHATFATADLSI